MKRIHIKKPDIKGKFQKLRHLKTEDIKAYWHQKKLRREAILEKRRNSAFAKKMQPVYKEMNRFSLVLQMLYACVINLVIEAISRHSLFEAWDYMVGSPWTFLFNTYLIFITFLLAYLVRRRVFVRVLIERFLDDTWNYERLYVINQGNTV